MPWGLIAASAFLLALGTVIAVWTIALRRYKLETLGDVYWSLIAVILLSVLWGALIYKISYG
jgi:hypothetical protein